MMLHPRRGGIGQCTNGYDQYGDACTDFTPITSNPTLLSAANSYINPLSNVDAPTSGSTTAGTTTPTVAQQVSALISQFGASAVTPTPNTQPFQTSALLWGLAAFGLILVMNKKR